ncbi:MAG: hypothetical protein AB7J34_11705 [Limisphaerales bacterium]
MNRPPRNPVALALAMTLAPLIPSGSAEPQARLIPQLESFRPYIGKTWRGEFKNSTPEKPIVDISRWERALNGTAIRTLHSINQGQYGGESLIIWDAAKGCLAYHYITTAGFMTIGSMSVVDSRIISTEKVVGDAGGVTEVRATTEIRADGTMFTQSEFLKNGKWEPGHSVVYVEDPRAEVVFQ